MSTSHGGGALAPMLGVVVLTLILIGWSACVQGQTVERLVMPGPVITGHVEFEDDCAKCHAVLDDIPQRRLCLDCHEAVNADIEKVEGYHGRIDNVRDRECADCHTDHEGRDADIVGLNEAAFDHARTDFPLRGLHVDVSCSACHRDDKAWHEAPSTCVSCHKAEDPHAGALGERCGDCHGEFGWEQAVQDFDHDAETDFPLVNAHTGLTCSACHVDESYQNTPPFCAGCHGVNDVHQGRLGSDCVQCHDDTAWADIKFDHEFDTRFALTGQHATLACERCHTVPPKEKAPSTGCISCHQGDDAHNGKNGTDCRSCHNTGSWLAADFDHAKETGFPLLESHAPLSCASCHPGEKAEQKGAVCFDCHQADDPHEGALGTVCGDCHRESTWFGDTRFDHDLTLFPLIGQHVTVACGDCHQSKVFRGEEAACVACHADDDAHERNLGLNCGNCHNPNDWLLWQFDHNEQTDFDLRGLHVGLQCASCHLAPLDEPDGKPSPACGDCHRSDDVHRGAFGRSCGTCHNSDSFRDVRIRR